VRATTKIVTSMKKPSLFLSLIVTAILNFKALQGFQFVPIGKRCTITKNFPGCESKLYYVDSKTTTIDTSDFDEVSARNPGLKKPVKNNVVKAPLKLGVLLLNLGGPETMDDVEGFLYNLFADPDIIRLPSFFSFLQKPIAYFIAKRRAPKSSAAYLSIGGGSPIVKYTKAQADLIQLSLRKKGLKDAKCYFAMRYWNPYTEEVLEQMHNDGINSMVILPLYPQYSISTSGSSLKLLSDIFYNEPDKWGPDKVTHTVVPAWYYRPGYVKTMASMIVEVS
jgi:Ferrochelatase